MDSLRNTTPPPTREQLEAKLQRQKNVIRNSKTLLTEVLNNSPPSSRQPENRRLQIQLEGKTRALIESQQENARLREELLRLKAQDSVPKHKEKSRLLEDQLRGAEAKIKRMEGELNLAKEIIPNLGKHHAKKLVPQLELMNLILLQRGITTVSALSYVLEGYTVGLDLKRQCEILHLCLRRKGEEQGGSLPALPVEYQKSQFSQYAKSSLCDYQLIKTLAERVEVNGSLKAKIEAFEKRHQSLSSQKTLQNTPVLQETTLSHERALSILSALGTTSDQTLIKELPLMNMLLMNNGIRSVSALAELLHTRVALRQEMKKNESLRTIIDSTDTKTVKDSEVDALRSDLVEETRRSQRYLSVIAALRPHLTDKWREAIAKFLKERSLRYF